MDFVVSKVALSICALLVVAVLGNVYGQGAFRDIKRELEGVAMDLVSTTSAMFEALTECQMSWDAPRLAAGEEISVEVSQGSIRVSTDSSSATIATPLVIHTWRWDGLPLDIVIVQNLDADTPPTVVRSDGTIILSTSLIPVGTELQLMVFAHGGD
jgi:hypothetical protein